MILSEDEDDGGFSMDEDDDDLEMADMDAVDLHDKDNDDFDPASLSGDED